jgi:hypothetical protein
MDKEVKESKALSALNKEVLSKNYEGWKALERTQRFKKFVSENPGIENPLGAFLQTFEGGEVAWALGLKPREMAIHMDPRLNEGILTIHINLHYSKERLREEFALILEDYHHLVKRGATPVRGEAILKKDKIDLMYRAYDLVEKYEGKYLQVTWELFPETNGKQPKFDETCDTDNKLQQVKRWHQKVKNRIAIGDRALISTTLR